jgi:uncharacterized membrane-anchored protein
MPTAAEDHAEWAPEEHDRGRGRRGEGGRSRWTAGQMLRKTPQVSALFWIIKLLTTAMGESTSDYLVTRFNPYVVVVAGFVGFVAALALQMAQRRYIAWVYWLAVLAVAIFGTMAADVTHVVLGVPYLVSTGVFLAVLALIFAAWQRWEGTLSIHSITTRRRELFYWATVSATFALGTAAGDLAAYTARLGFLAAGVLFAAVFALPGLGRWLWKWNAVFAFWFAYILTRPLGASFADWTGKARAAGGLGWGDGPVAAVLFVLILLGVGWLSRTRADVEEGASL